MTIWSNRQFSQTGNIYPMNSASIPASEHIINRKDIRIAKRVYDPYAETQMSAATVNKNFQNPLSIYKNPKMAANPKWHPEFDYRFHPVKISGYNGSMGVSNNPNIVPSAYSKHPEHILIDKQHATAGTAINNDYDTDLVQPKNDAIANAVKSKAHSQKVDSPTTSKYWNLNQNLYAPLQLDSMGNRTGAEIQQMAGTDMTNPSSQYLTQQYQIPVPLPRYDAFEPEAEIKPNIRDRFEDMKTSPVFPVIVGAAIVAAIVIYSSGNLKKVIPWPWNY